MSKSVEIFLFHIFNEIEFLKSQTKDLSQDQFMHDQLLQRAFARSLEIIGEAAKQIPDKFREKHKEIDWKALAGLRDKLIHHYFGIDYAIVWDVIKNELPRIKNQINKIIEVKES